MPDHNLLLLGGTGEAALLAGAIVARFGGKIALTTSLAGRTARPMAIPRRRQDRRLRRDRGADRLSAGA